MIPSEYMNQVVIGDSVELGERIPDNSIDLGFTDPPYPKEFLHCYSDVAKLYSRVLKTNSLAFIYAGNDNIPEVLSRVSEHLTYRCTIALIHGASQIVWSSRFIATWKPIFVFSKGDWSEQPVLNGKLQGGNGDKRFHDWGQPEWHAIKYIELHTQPGDIVLDPYCGGGQTAVACISSGRNFITFEINPETAKIAQERIALANPPLFLLEQKQLEMPLLSL